MSWLLPALRQRAVESLVLGLAPNVHDRSEHDTEVMRCLRSRGIPVRTLGVERAADPRRVLALVEALRAFHPAVVHTYLFHAGIATRPIARLFTRAAIVSSVVDVDYWKTPFTARADALSLRLADRILVNAYAVKDRLLRDSAALAPSITVQYNGVDLTRIAAAPSARTSLVNRIGCARDDRLLGVVARLHRQKAPDVALRIFAELAGRSSDIRLAFVGSGPMEPDLRQMAASLEIDDRVSFLGSVPHDDVFGLLKAFDVLLLPSRWEGLPGVVLEALAARVPVVATSVGGTPEVIVHGENGLLAPPEAVNALADLCRRVLDDSGLRERLVESGFKTAQRFPHEDMVDRRLDLYKSITRRDASRPA
jgi:glycosyltransferase involved in cell wall biosynthesis